MRAFPPAPELSLAAHPTLSRQRKRASRTGAVVAALAALIALLLAAGRLSVPPDEYGDLSPEAADRLILCALAAGGLYLLTVFLLRRLPVPRWAVLAGIGFGLLARLVLLTTPPVMSTDLYRYVWDGRTQAHGINPYRYIPADPALASLRDHRDGPEAIFININRPETARTIYPPAAQILFALIGQVWSSIWGIKSAMLLFDLLAGWAAWRLLRAAGRPEGLILIWALNPLAVNEFAGAGHIDAAAMALSAVALLLAARGRAAGAGAALGVAVLFKLLPAALGPAIWRPRTVRAPALAVATILAGYLIYASVGTLVFGYLGGYAEEEGIEQGGGFVWLRLLARVAPLPHWAGTAYLAVSLLFLAGLALFVLRQPGPPRADVITDHALLLSLALMLTLSPHYPWYLTALIVPAVVWPALGALWPTAAGPLLYWDAGLHAPWWPAIVFIPPAVWLGGTLWRRTRHA